MRQILNSMSGQEQAAIFEWSFPFLAAVEAQGEGMRRADLWRLLADTDGPSLFTANGGINPVHRWWNQFTDQVRQLTSDGRYWDPNEKDSMRRVRTAIEVRGSLCPSDLVVLGGEPDWVQNDETPRCRSCKFLMHLFVQVKSPSAVDLSDEPELQEFEQGDAGTTYVFRCYQCSRYEVIEQNH